MVTQFGMSEIGQFSLESPNNEVFLGRDWMSKSEYSEEIAAQIDRKVREILIQCYETAKRLIQENRIVVDHLVEILIEQETIDGEQFRQIVTEYNSHQVADAAKLAVPN